MDTIFDYSARGIEQLLESLGQPKFRGKQLVQWLYKHGVKSYDEMTNLPAKLRSTLAKVAPLIPPAVALETRARTQKSDSALLCCV